MKLKDVPNLMIERQTRIGPMGDDERDMLVFNDALSQMSEREITLNKEKLALTIHKVIFNKEMEENTLIRNLEIYALADAIISAEKDLR